MTDTSSSRAENPPQTNGITDNGILDEEDEKSKMRPADIDADMREMERRKRVEMIMNSRLFREELERIIELQIKDGGSGPAGLLQQISDMMGIQGGRLHTNNMFKSSNCVVPINDIRGVESMGYAKGEKILRCKLAAVYRLIDLYGWAQSIYNHITARLNQDEEHFLINPFGMLYHEITASSLVKVDMQGGVVESGTTNFGVNVPGFQLHAAIHSARPDIKCIIHIHTPSVLAVSSLKSGLLPLCQESIVIGEVSQHHYHGALYEPEEKEKIARNLGPVNKVMFLTNHGAVCCGETIEEAFYNVYNTVLACETQIKVMPLGVDNLILVPDETRKLIYDSVRHPPDGANLPPATIGEKKEKRWRVGGLEFEALMRMLDNAGFRTGYIYRQPLVKNEPPRPRNDVEVPPAVSSLGYLLEEEELYKSGNWKKFIDGRKSHDRTRWLNSPNVYQKVEILETGTPDPKKITKWVDANADEWVAEGSPTHSSTPVKIESALQFVPKNTNPKEFKKLQQQIKENRRADKITSGPQSHILEGVSWEEAKKLQDANISQTGDQVILVGAASKGIIQRGFQHNATVYKAPYAKNPFDTITDQELEDYKKVVTRKQKGESSYEEDQSESEALSSSAALPPTGIKSPASETEEESRDEPRVLRIETKTAPRPSQPEVVLSDDESDLPASPLERAHSIHLPTKVTQSDAFTRTQSLKSGKLLNSKDNPQFGKSHGDGPIVQQVMVHSFNGAQLFPPPVIISICDKKRFCNNKENYKSDINMCVLSEKRQLHVKLMSELQKWFENQSQLSNLSKFQAALIKNEDSLLLNHVVSDSDENVCVANELNALECDRDVINDTVNYNEIQIDCNILPEFQHALITDDLSDSDKSSSSFSTCSVHSLPTSGISLAYNKNVNDFSSDTSVPTDDELKTSASQAIGKLQNDKSEDSDHSSADMVSSTIDYIGHDYQGGGSTLTELPKVLDELNETLLISCEVFLHTDSDESNSASCTKDMGDFNDSLLNFKSSFDDSSVFNQTVEESIIEAVSIDNNTDNFQLANLVDDKAIAPDICVAASQQSTGDNSNNEESDELMKTPSESFEEKSKNTNICNKPFTADVTFFMDESVTNIKSIECDSTVCKPEIKTVEEETLSTVEICVSAPNYLDDEKLLFNHSEKPVIVFDETECKIKVSQVTIDDESSDSCFLDGLKLLMDYDEPCAFINDENGIIIQEETHELLDINDEMRTCNEDLQDVLNNSSDEYAEGLKLLFKNSEESIGIGYSEPVINREKQVLLNNKDIGGDVISIENVHCRDNLTSDYESSLNEDLTDNIHEQLKIPNEMFEKDQTSLISGFTDFSENIDEITNNEPSNELKFVVSETNFIRQQYLQEIHGSEVSTDSVNIILSDLDPEKDEQRGKVGKTEYYVSSKDEENKENLISEAYNLFNRSDSVDIEDSKLEYHDFQGINATQVINVKALASSTPIQATDKSPTHSSADGCTDIFVKQGILEIVEDHSPGITFIANDDELCIRSDTLEGSGYEGDNELTEYHNGTALFSHFALVKPKLFNSSDGIGGSLSQINYINEELESPIQDSDNETNSKNIKCELKHFSESHAQESEDYTSNMYEEDTAALINTSSEVSEIEEDVIICTSNEGRPSENITEEENASKNNDSLEEFQFFENLFNEASTNEDSYLSAHSVDDFVSFDNSDINETISAELDGTCEPLFTSPVVNSRSVSMFYGPKGSSLRPIAESDSELLSDEEK